MGESVPTIAIVILTCNAKKMLLECLKSVSKLNSISFKKFIVVVDNGSKEDVPAAVLKEFPNTVVIDNKINYGFAKGINFGARFAYLTGADYVFFLNDDTQFSPDFLEKLYKEARLNNYLICGPKILSKDGKIWSLGGKINKLRFSGGLIGYGEKDHKEEENQKVDFISGTAMLVKREVFEKIGYFNEDYFLYYDDCDFCCRANKIGIDSYIVSKSEIIHLETVTIKKNSPSHYYHAAKSHLIFVLRQAPFEIKIRELIRTGKTLLQLITEKNIIKRKYELLALRDFFLHYFGQKTSVKPF